MIIIAGAGIGGLTLGCALKRAGLPFRIFERAAELRPAGAGIALAPNALQALAHLGLADRVCARGHELGVAALCNPDGRRIMTAPIREIAAGGILAMTRTSLQEVLFEALDVPVECGRAVAAYEATTEGVRVHFADGSSAEGDAIVAADGLRSAVRRAMRGDEPVRYSGQTSWRALVDVRLDDVSLMTETWGAGQRFGVVPLTLGSVYWFATADAPAAGHDEPGFKARLQAMFAGWHAPIARVLDATDEHNIVRTDICDRPPISSWIDGRAVLLGDAAHPMTPDMGMGGCQAIEDAVVLADALAREASVDRALVRYQRQRLDRANRFVNRSIRMGRLAHLRPPVLRWLRDRALGAVPVSATARAMASDFEFNLSA